MFRTFHILRHFADFSEIAEEAEGRVDWMVQPFLIIVQPSTIMAQPSTIMAKPSTIIAQPYTIMAQPSTIIAQPSTIMFQPSTIIAQASLVMVQPPSVHTIQYSSLHFIGPHICSDRYISVCSFIHV